MTSARRIAANRMNGRKSRGPRTQAGKARASRNALRHGFWRFSNRNHSSLPEIEQTAKVICGADGNPLLFEQALLIAENDLLICWVRLERVAVIERLRDPTTRPLARKDNSIKLAKARMADYELAHIELARTWKLLDEKGEEGANAYLAQPNEVTGLGWKPALQPDRDEHEALREALPDLIRLQRYQRRAWLRRNKAIRQFITIKATAG